MRINTNMAAMNAWKAMETNQTHLQSSLERLSSGYRINKAADDAAGLAVSEKLKAQTRGTAMATRNAQDAVSLVQTAEGGASKIQDMLQRMRELAVQAGSDTLQDTDRAQLQEEFSSLNAEIDRTADSVQFNGIKLIDGSHNRATATPAGTTNVSVSGIATGSIVVTSAVNGSSITALTVNGTDISADTNAYSYDSATGLVVGKGTYAGFSFNVAANTTATITVNDARDLTFQVGANNAETITTSFGNLKGANMGLTGLSIGNKTNATAAITTLDKSVTFVSSQRAKMGATQNRLDNIISTLQTQNENITAAESRIREVDMAAEMASFTKYQVLSQASTAMLAQANQLPQGVLSLLR